MDLDSITVADFKSQFWRIFPFLNEYDNTKLYNTGVRVYYTPTELFYDCIVNGTQGILPTDTDNWIIVADSVENYVLDKDVEAAFAEANVTFNQSLFGTDDQIKLGFLYLTAHYLSNDLKAALGGATGMGAAGILTSKSAGNVAESYGIPQAYLDDPILSFLTSTAFGLKYLSMVLPLLRGNIGVVFGRTIP